MAILVSRKRFTVGDYHKMIRSGVFSEDERLELVDGEVVEMSPIGSEHAACVNRWNRVLSKRLGDRVIVGIQNPITLGDRSEPQPDVTLLHPRPDDYSSSHPGPDDIYLVIEVADTSADQDRELKIPLYAAHGIEEAWLVDLSRRRIEVYRRPGRSGYAEVRVVDRGELAPIAFPDLGVDPGEIFGVG